ncbi:MAG TPA: AraC family transcriptional regulator [Noviherbaspirillum sp.]|nr:AraC family transcriptional regulator [Noviherbaspirillum sp.]
MPGQEFMRSIASMRVMAELAVDYGMPLDACLSGTGVSQHSLADPDALVTAEQELRLVRNLVERLGDQPSLGLEAGRRYHFTAFGTLGLAMVSSPSMRHALDVAMRYFDLAFAFTRFHVEDSDDQTLITLDDSAIPTELRRFVVERDVCAMITTQRDLFAGTPVLQRLTFSFGTPANVSDYTSVFGVSPVFGARTNVAAFDRRLIESPLPQANELAQRAAEEQCRRLLEVRRVQASIAERVRERLVSDVSQMPDMELVARQLCMTTRTLRRHLLAGNTSFMELRDKVLQDRAQELLCASKLSVEQIGERLGYSEATCFINAFKRWTGQTPHAYRLQKRAQQQGCVR